MEKRLENIMIREPVMMLQYNQHRDWIEEIEKDVRIYNKTDWKSSDSLEAYCQTMWEEGSIYYQEPTYEEWLELDQAYLDLQKWKKKRADRERELLEERIFRGSPKPKDKHPKQYEFSFKWTAF